jgi:2-polyprenyl-6-hydroxyphenyl methylase/3-demethylubiquinone-9 3-methyltransferase
MPPVSSTNVDPAELSRFARHADEWWDPEGPFKPLHALNPVRLRYIDDAVPLAGRTVLDAGCGGGLLAEAMAARGARVTGIDAGAEAISAAERHARESGLPVRYETGTIEEYAASSGAKFDVITCMELLEHVPEPVSILRAAATLLEPGGHLVLSTINRTPQAFLAAIVGAEYIAGLLPRGTHDYARFIRPSELAAWLRAAGFTVLDVTGVRYLPWANRCMLARSPAVNYMMHARKD